MTELAIIAVGILLWSNTRAGKKWLKELKVFIEAASCIAAESVN